MASMIPALYDMMDASVLLDSYVRNFENKRVDAMSELATSLCKMAGVNFHGKANNTMVARHTFYASFCNVDMDAVVVVAASERMFV